MSGRGGGAKGLGAGGAKRHRKVLRDNLSHISQLEIRRCARRGGVKHISGLVYPEIRGCLKSYLEKVMHDALYMKACGRKTVSPLDIVHALKRHGTTLYGFDKAFLYKWIGGDLCG
jgi:histone H4